MKLYEITQALESVINNGFYVDTTNGELFDATDLEALEAAYTDKLEACGLALKNYAAEVEAFKAEEKRLQERRRVVENRHERLKAYVEDQMKLHDGEPLETPRVSLRLRRSEAVVVDESSFDMSSEYTTTKTTVAPDKKALKEALKAGAEIKGAYLVERENLQVK